MPVPLRRAVLERDGAARLEEGRAEDEGLGALRDGRERRRCRGDNGVVEREGELVRSLRGGVRGGCGGWRVGGGHGFGLGGSMMGREKREINYLGREEVSRRNVERVVNGLFLGKVVVLWG